MKILIFLFIFVSTSDQDIDDPSDERPAFSSCTKNNVVPMFSNENLLRKKLDELKKFEEDVFLKLLYDSYSKDIQGVLERSISDTYKHLNLIQEKSTSDWVRSDQLELLFIGFFEIYYINLYDLESCRKKDPIYFDFPSLLEPTVSVINDYFKSDSKLSCEDKQFTEYLGYDYLFKMAVNMYQPKLKKYTTREVLLKKVDYVMSEDYDDDANDYLWELIDG